MEFIEGRPLDAYAKDRELKPDNIIVTDGGEATVLDFGVVRATDSDINTATIQTDVGQIIGTVRDVSPEQVAGDSDEIDARSDVYLLGVVLYELLAGRRPHELEKTMLREVVRIIREDDPKPLSAFDRVLSGDVDTIVAKAMEKDKLWR
ncbi:MAG: protein kinase [Planctomycetota bacterium]